MSAALRYAVRPSTPPKPPLRTGTGCAKGDAVCPASDIVTLTSRRPASTDASSRASVVPPRIRTRRVMSFASATDQRPASGGPWLSIVGIGEDGVEGLTKRARDL